MYKNPFMTPFGLLAVAPTKYWPFLDAELKYTASMALKKCQFFYKCLPIFQILPLSLTTMAGRSP